MQIEDVKCLFKRAVTVIERSNTQDALSAIYCVQVFAFMYTHVTSIFCFVSQVNLVHSLGFLFELHVNVLVELFNHSSVVLLTFLYLAHELTNFH